MTQLREFTKYDWMTYSGAQRFEDGSEPLIAEGEYFDIIIDEELLSVQFHNDAIRPAYMASYNKIRKVVSVRNLLLKLDAMNEKEADAFMTEIGYER